MRKPAPFGEYEIQPITVHQTPDERRATAINARTTGNSCDIEPYEQGTPDSTHCKGHGLGAMPLARARVRVTPERWDFPNLPRHWLVQAG